MFRSLLKKIIAQYEKKKNGSKKPCRILFHSKNSTVISEKEKKTFICQKLNFNLRFTLFWAQIWSANSFALAAETIYFHLSLFFDKTVKAKAIWSIF